jgi:hypothetical protein
MTTALLQQNHPGLGILAGLVFLLFAIVDQVGILGVPSPALAAIEPNPQFRYHSHSVEKHSEDALAIIKCMYDKGGADKIWISNTFYARSESCSQAKPTLT